MDMTITGKNIAVTESLRDYVKKKIGKVEKYFNQLLDAHVTLTVEKLNHITEVTINGDNVTFHAEVKSEDMYASIDILFEKLEKQIRRYKEKVTDRRNRNKNEFLPGSSIGEERFLEEGIDGIQIFEADNKPMLPSEAVLQLDLNKFRFLMFKRGLESVETPEEFRKHNYAIVYRRKSGDYAVVELDGNEAKLHLYEKKEESGEVQKRETRGFNINVMTHEDAALALLYLRADYYIFQNMDDKKLNIVYQLANGGMAVKIPPAN